MKKTKVLVTIILVLTIIATIAEIILSLNNGTTFNWATVAPIYCSITCFYTCLAADEKKNKETKNC